RFLDVAAQAGLVIVGLILLPGSLPPIWREKVFGYLLLFATFLLIFLITGYLIYRETIARSSWKVCRRLVKIHHAIRSVKRRPLVLVTGWLAGTAIQFTFLILTALLAISCGLALPLRVWLFAWPLAKLAAILPLTQGGIGVREAALVALLAPF